MTWTAERITGGFLAGSGLLSDQAARQAVELVARAEAENLETVRMVFADPHGVLRGKTVTVSALVDAFASGVRVPSTLLLKDLSHRTVFPVWSATGDAPLLWAGDVVLVPVPASFRTLEWSPHSALLHCDVATTRGEPVALAPRQVLRTACEQLAGHGLHAVMGLEVEFRSSMSSTRRVNMPTPRCRPDLPGPGPTTRGTAT